MNNRTPEQDAAIDEAIERLAKVMALRRCNPEVFPKGELITAIMRAAIIIQRDTPAHRPVSIISNRSLQ